jgi:hypothetical protein
MQFPLCSCLYAPVLWEELHNPTITGLSTCNKKKCTVFNNQLKRVNEHKKRGILPSAPQHYNGTNSSVTLKGAGLQIAAAVWAFKLQG